MKDDKKHGADRIPVADLDKVKALLCAGDRQKAGELLDSLAVKYKLKSFEAHHLAQHLLTSTGPTIRELRERFPFKPHDSATLDGRQVEVISYPYPDDPRPVGILVRTTPGDPGTMIAVEAGYLERVG